MQTRQLDIQIDLIDVDIFSLMRDKSSPPAGITLRGPVGTSLNSDDATAGPAFIMMTIVVPIALNVVSNFIFEYLSKHKAKRIRIERTEINFHRGEIERILREKTELDF